MKLKDIIPAPPKEATLPKVADREPWPAPAPPSEVAKFAPLARRFDDPHDPEAMVRATAAYTSLRHTLDQQREQLERQREEISHQRNRIDLLEHSLNEAKNVANEYRAEADDARAESASWKAFFANVQAVFNQYKLPTTTPQKKEVKEYDGMGDVTPQDDTRDAGLHPKLPQ